MTICLGLIALWLLAGAILLWHGLRTAPIVEN